MSVHVTPHQSQGVYQIILDDGSQSLATRNLVPGRRVYGERLVTVNSDEYRLWSPYHSKLAAALHQGLSRLPLTSGQRLLYLGAASGTTVSHLSDIVGLNGEIYAIEFSPRPLRELVTNVSSVRKNVFPLLADARIPLNYRFFVPMVDGVYCDIAQPEQAKILADNAEIFLKVGGYAFLAIKGRSITSTEDLSTVFQKEVDLLKQREFRIEETLSLNPFDRAHMMVYATFKP